MCPTAFGTYRLLIREATPGQTEGYQESTGLSDRYVPRHPDIFVLHLIVRRHVDRIRRRDRTRSDAAEDRAERCQLPKDGGNVEVHPDGCQLLFADYKDPILP